MSKSNDVWMAERDRIVGEYVAGIIDAAHAVLALKRLGYEGWEARDLLHMAAEPSRWPEAFANAVIPIARGRV